jgi:hypothetical protein
MSIIEKSVTTNRLFLVTQLAGNHKIATLSGIMLHQKGWHKSAFVLSTGLEAVKTYEAYKQKKMIRHVVKRTITELVCYCVAHVVCSDLNNQNTITL